MEIELEEVTEEVMEDVTEETEEVNEDETSGIITYIIERENTEYEESVLVGLAEVQTGYETMYAELSHTNRLLTVIMTILFLSFLIRLIKPISKGAKR